MSKRDETALDKEKILQFLNWVARTKGCQLCSAGYAGEMLPIGPDEELVDEFLVYYKS
jgi:hypothetical protein